MVSLSSLQHGLAFVLTSTLVACAAPTTSSEAPSHMASTTQAIVGGTTSTPQHDAVVMLTIAGADGKTHACTGTLVAKNLVLTARHCVGAVDSARMTVENYRASAISVYVGVDAPARIASGEAPAAVGSELVTGDTDAVIPDVAFVVLDGRVDAPVAPIRVGTGSKKGESLVVVGFGLDESNAAPSTRKQREGVTVTAIGPAKTPLVDVRAGELAVGEAACFGDSGGPALSAKTGAVVGVASRVSNGIAAGDTADVARCMGAEDVYTSLAPVKDLVAKAFAAASAEPLVESGAGVTDESATTPATSEPSATAPAASTADDLASRDASRGSPAMSCAASSASPRASELGLFAILAAIAVLTMRRRA